jgi:DNA-binding SARP family transcriptional activator
MFSIFPEQQRGNWREKALSREAGIPISNQIDSGGSSWSQAIEFMSLVRTEYERARKQLEEVTSTLSQKEAELDRHMRQAVLLSSRYQPLCLVAYGEGGTFSLMGSTILGDAIPISVVQIPVRLEVRLLGQFEVHSDRKTIQWWQSAKAKAIFQYMITHPRLIPRETLMEKLWPGADPESAGNNLKTAIHNLRRSLCGLFRDDDNYQFIFFLQGNYLMNREIEIWIDTEEFEKHWASGRLLGKQGRVEEARREFENAELLYRGDYLEDEPYEDWTNQRRESLKDTYISILSRLADYSAAAADYESCIVYCQKILAKDACREDAYRNLICCHSRLGRRNRARDWYQICRRTIWSELEALPEKETTDLYWKLIRNEPV